MSTSPKISFCTTCANRLYQFDRVFDHNLRAIHANPDTEWIILNFSSADGLHEYMLERLPRISARVAYVHFAGQAPWHSSVAKNLAHCHASGEIVVNLDSDNFIGDTIAPMRSFFSQGCRVLHIWSGTFVDGTYGRIALCKRVFDQLGGYNESFHPMGYQDTDLLRRAQALHIPVFTLRTSGASAIPNSKIDSIRHCRRTGYTWRDYNNLNMQMSFRDIWAGNLVANLHRTSPPREVEIRRGALPG